VNHFWGSKNWSRSSYLKQVRNIAIRLVRGYQWLVSPLIGNNCRFHPTCSEYCVESIHKHGVIVGGWYSLVRILRCGPWSKGGIDEVK